MIFLQSEEVPQEQKNFVKDVLSGYRVSEDEVLRCVEIVASSSAVEKSRTEAVKFVEKARAGLANLPQGQAWDILNGLLDYAVNRSH
jgi:geranylgeranyl pyrophosphate synthase